MDQDSGQTIDALIGSLAMLKEEAVREGQNFIAYAIEDALIQAKAVRNAKFVPQVANNLR